MVLSPAAPRGKRRRVEEPLHDVESQVRGFLEEKPAAGMDLEGDVEVCEMSQAQLNDSRDMGLAVVAMEVNSFGASSRTFILAMSLFDRYLQKTVKVVDIGPPVPGGQALPPARSQHGAHNSIEVPAACFLIACKIVEVN